MKVYEQSGYQYKSTPAIMLKGQWLREAGFDCGTSITVTCEEGRLVIVPREEASYVDVFEESGRETADKGAEKILSEILDPLREKYDYILIDTCSSLGMLTINALAAADEVIIAVNPQLLAMMGLQDYLRTVTKIRIWIYATIPITDFGFLLPYADGVFFRVVHFFTPFMYCYILLYFHCKKRK